MTNSKQAAKRTRQNERRRAQNRTVRSSMRSAMKKVVEADTAEDAQAALPDAMSKLDRAAREHEIHPNAAARQKSRLSRAANKTD